MKWAQRQRTKTLLLALVFLATLGIFLGWLSRRQGYRNVLTVTPSPGSEPSPFTTPPPPLTSASPSSEVSPAPTPSADNSNAQSSATPTAGLIIPVAGVSSAQLIDTFTAARGDGRVHDAIDITAPKGTPVLAVAPGKILRLFQSKAGGTTIYQSSGDEKFIYYYAHLERYADGLYEGGFVMQGQTIAYVGDTGNAGAGNYHLHFSVAMTSDPKRWWEGVNINPYPLLRK
ncbi:MAG: M23 family metallopeptidase [Pyrinomonadaceae bacterium]